MVYLAKKIIISLRSSTMKFIWGRSIKESPKISLPVNCEIKEKLLPSSKVMVYSPQKE